MAKKCTYCGAEYDDDRLVACPVDERALVSWTEPPKGSDNGSIHHEAKTLEPPIDRTVWIEPEELGSTRILRHQGRELTYRIPTSLDSEIILRFKGFKPTRRNPNGEYYLKLKLDRGDHRRRALFISNKDAVRGGPRILGLPEEKIAVMVPERATDGCVIHVKGKGEQAPFRLQRPLHRGPRGDLFVEIKTFPELVQPRWRGIEGLSSDELALQSWVYRRVDWIMEILGSRLSRVTEVSSRDIADEFNRHGVSGIFRFLCGHIGVPMANVPMKVSSTIKTAGQCLTRVRTSDGSFVNRTFEIEIRDDCTRDPFLATAVLSHELCHVIEAEEMVTTEELIARKGASLADERTIDLLVFLFGLGEFQLRVARSHNMVLGYFDQDTFERMYVLAAQKLGRAVGGKKHH